MYIKILSTFVFSVFLSILCMGKSLASSVQKELPEKLIYMVVWNGETVTDRGFLDFFKYKGHKIKVVVLNLNQEKGKIAPAIEEVKRVKPDLLYIYGSVPCIEMLGTLDSVQDDKHITNIPVLAYIIQPVSAGLLKSFGASGRNFTGISIAVDPKSQVNAILQYSPKIRKITALYSSLEPNAVASVKLFEEAARQAGLELTHVNFAVKDNAVDPSSIYSTIQEAKKTNPDLVYLPPDGFILKNSEEICKYLNDEKLPSFTGMEFGIEKAQTALFGVVASSYAAGQMGALLANKILYQGENPGAIPFEYVPEISFIVRSDTLRKTNFFPSINVVDAAKFIDGPMYADQKR